MIEFKLSPAASEYKRRYGMIDDFDLLGFLPQMLDESDPRPAVEQLHEGYAHGGGWRPFQGFKLSPAGDELRYPGDPPMQLIAEAQLRSERIALFESSWVAVVQPNGEMAVCRMD